MTNASNYYQPRRAAQGFLSLDCRAGEHIACEECGGCQDACHSDLTRQMYEPRHGDGEMWCMLLGGIVCAFALGIFLVGVWFA